MHSFTRYRPSPSMVVALIALVAATGGTATALSGKNVVKKDDLAKNSVSARAIAKNAVSRSEVKKNAVSSGEIKNGAVKADEVDESSLGQVPDAATVGGNLVRRFSVRSPGAIATSQILNLGGLQLFARCTADGIVTLTAKTTTADSELSTFTHSGGGDAFNNDDSFSPGDTFDVPDVSASDEVGEGRFTGADGRFVHFTYTHEENTGANDCLLNGFAMSSG